MFAFSVNQALVLVIETWDQSWIQGTSVFEMAFFLSPGLIIPEPDMGLTKEATEVFVYQYELHIDSETWS